MDKKSFKTYKAYSKMHGIKSASSEVPGTGYRGVSVAYKLSLPSEDCRMLLVAVSYCAETDVYDKRTGRAVAIDRMGDGQLVQLPLGQALLLYGDDWTKQFLLDMFSV